MNKEHIVSMLLLVLLSWSRLCFADTSTAVGNGILDKKLNTARALYPIADRKSKHTAVSFVQDGAKLKAVFPDGEVLWTAAINGTGVFGGFDFDSDGWIDLGFTVSKSTGTIRGGKRLQTTQIILVRGKTGELIEITTPLEDKWWQKLGYATSQWSGLSLLFGNSTPVFSLSPYYAKQGFFYQYANGTFMKYRYEYPSTPSYDTAYRNDRPNAYDQGQSYIRHSHVNNGLFVKVDDQDRLLFFSSSRVLQYAVKAFGPEQLLYDHPFLNGGRKDLGGRQYGLVAIGPTLDSVTIVSGIHAKSVYRDLKKGKMETDPWGGIERHVTIYDFIKNSMDHRFYSSAHDHGDEGGKYQKRVAYPDTVHIPTKPGQASRIAYNVYQDEQWYLHISKPGSTLDETVLAGLFLWDIIERSGRTKLIISPIDAADKQDTRRNYFPQWRTGVYVWDEANPKLVSINSIEDGIPHLLPRFRQGDKTTFYGWLYPVVTVAENGVERLLLEGRDGKLFLRGSLNTEAKEKHNERIEHDR